ncbi:hypothetical protein DFJ77DRAFT_305185 [Powellomyces hirtus]|nr:hypothetical protein DFJ77DRAFT_305185 [Powellomyces hirtus]
MLLRLPARGAKLPRTFLRFNSTALAHQPAPPPAPSPQRKWPPRGTRPTALSTPESPHPPNHHILIAHKDDLVLDDSVVAAQAEPIVLSDEQESLIELLLSGKNVFFTGKAGTGKTEVLRQFVERARGLGKRVAVTVCGDFLTGLHVKKKCVEADLYLGVLGFASSLQRESRRHMYAPPLPFACGLTRPKSNRARLLLD